MLLKIVYITYTCDILSNSSTVLLITVLFLRIDTNTIILWMGKTLHEGENHSNKQKPHTTWFKIESHLFLNFRNYNL